MQIKLPELSLVVLLGAAGSGKTTFARRHFQEEEILSREKFQRMVSGNDRSPKAIQDASETLEYIIQKRLQNKLLTVVDGAHVSEATRKAFRILAKKNHVALVGIWLDLPREIISERNASRGDKAISSGHLSKQLAELAQSEHRFKTEGFNTVHRLTSVEDLAQTEIKRRPLWCNKTEVTGPFDIIGDVHGCFDELHRLLADLGYQVQADAANEGRFKVTPPQGRKIIFVGDLVDRGPQSPQVLKLAMDMVRDGVALCVTGNHDDKLKRFLMGRNVKLAHGLELTVEQLSNETDAFKEEVLEFLRKLPDHLVLDHGALTVAHAGLKEEMQGRQSGAVRSFCLYGETSGETDEFGLPVRHNWAGEYKGQSMVVYGHTPVPEAIWQNQTINIDTGCVFGGNLSALRYPEREIHSVPAKKVYSEPKRPLAMNLPKVEQTEGTEMIDMERIAGRNLVNTRRDYFVTIKDEKSPPVVELLSQGRLNPRWLIYLPPRISPTKSSAQPGFLEHTEEALKYYGKKGLEHVLVEEVHGGEVVTVILGKNELTILNRFGIKGEGIGTVINSSGHRYFDSPDQEQQFLKEFRQVVDGLDLWSSLDTDWLCLTGEMVPGAGIWGDHLVNLQRLAAAGEEDITRTTTALREAQQAGLDTQQLLIETTHQHKFLQRFGETVKAYDCPAEQLQDYRFYPQTLLASEGKTYFDMDQVWHRNHWKGIGKDQESMFSPSQYHWVDLNDADACRAVSTWFEELSSQQSAGVVVSPTHPVMEAGTDLIQPGLSVRGKEYLRTIYGPDYDHPEKLELHRVRRLKDIRQLAVRQLALGEEALIRFVEKKDLTSVYECNFALLSLQASDIDPRL